MNSVGKPRGMEGIRTLKPRSLQASHRGQNDVYLELYMLHKEKERLGKELAQVEKRYEGISKRLQTIDARMEELRESSGQEDQKDKENVREAPTKGKGWKRMSVDY